MRTLRRQVKLTAEKLERLETKLLRRLDSIKRRVVEVQQQKEQLQKALNVNG